MPAEVNFAANPMQMLSLCAKECTHRLLHYNILGSRPYGTSAIENTELNQSLGLYRASRSTKTVPIIILEEYTLCVTLQLNFMYNRSQNHLYNKIDMKCYLSPRSEITQPLTQQVFHWVNSIMRLQAATHKYLYIYI